MKQMNESQEVFLDELEKIPDKEHCLLCKFFALSHTFDVETISEEAIDEISGACRRYPPKLVESVLRELIDEKPRADRVDTAFQEAAKTWPVYFPAVVAAQWCGEFKAAK